MNNEPLNPNELRELRGLLARLPDAPVSSNFTARVMQSVEREEARESRRWNILTWNWHALLPRFAVATGVFMFAGVALHQHAIYSQRAMMVKNVALVTGAQPMPSVEALQNFDAIQRMSQPVHADTGLLALAPDLQ